MGSAGAVVPPARTSARRTSRGQLPFARLSRSDRQGENCAHLLPAIFLPAPLRSRTRPRVSLRGVSCVKSEERPVYVAGTSGHTLCRAARNGGAHAQRFAEHERQLKPSPSRCCAANTPPQHARVTGATPASPRSIPKPVRIRLLPLSNANWSFRQRSVANIKNCPVYCPAPSGRKCHTRWRCR